MAKTSKKRAIETCFWEDEYIISLDQIEKLTYLYFLTNSLSTVTGIYKLSVSRATRELGIEKEMFFKIIERFTNAEKIYYIDGYIYVKNYYKYQPSNPNISKSLENTLAILPPHISNEIRKIGLPKKVIETKQVKLKTGKEIIVPDVTIVDTKGLNKVLNVNQQVASIINAFKAINPVISFSNKGFRASALYLIEKIGFQKSKASVLYAISIQSEQYAPVITNPTELKNKFGRLVAYCEKNKGASKDGITTLKL